MWQVSDRPIEAQSRQRSHRSFCRSHGIRLLLVLFAAAFRCLFQFGKVVRSADRSPVLSKIPRAASPLGRKSVFVGVFCCCCLWLPFPMLQGGPIGRSEPSPIQDPADRLAVWTGFGCFPLLCVLLGLPCSMKQGNAIGRSEQNIVQDPGDCPTDRTEFVFV